MKLSSHIVFNILLSTAVFSTFAGRLEEGKVWVKGHKNDIALSAGSAAVGAALTYAATNQTVKDSVSKAGTTVRDFTQAKYAAIKNAWNNLSKGKKITVAGVSTALVLAAYYHFKGPGVEYVGRYFEKPAKV